MFCITRDNCSNSEIILATNRLIKPFDKRCYHSFGITVGNNFVECNFVGHNSRRYNSGGYNCGWYNSGGDDSAWYNSA